MPRSRAQPTPSAPPLDASLLDALPQIIWTRQPDGGAEYFNEQWYAYTGASGEPIAGWRWLEFLHADDRDRVRAHWAERARTGEPVEMEYRLRGSDGVYRWFLARGKATRDKSGAIVRWFGTSTDIDRRKTAEARLEQERRTLEAIDSIGRAVAAELDLHKLVQLVTDATTELTGAQFGAFFYNVVNSEGESYSLYTISGVPREAFSKFPMPRNTAVFGPTFNGEGVIRLDDVRRDSRYGRNAPYHGMPPGHLPVVSYLAVPVVSRSGEVHGGLFFGHERSGVFDERAERIAVGIAAQAATAIDNARLLHRARESEARFRQLANSIPQMAWITRPDGSVSWYNDRWYEFTGTTLEEMRGWGWQKVHHPDHLPRVLERWRQALAAGEPIEMEFPLRSASGEYRWFLTLVRPLRDEAGNIAFWFGTNTDISDRWRQREALRASEERLRAVVEATPECVKIVAPDGSLLYMNEAGLCAIEADGGVDVTGASVFDMVTSEYRDAWREHHARVCAGEKRSWEFEIIGRRGTRRWMETHAVPLPLEDGTVAHLAVTRDMTHRRQAEAEREELLESERQARAEAERASRMKDEFLATLSHELRTPLNAVLGWAQILRTRRDEATLEKGLETVERNARAQAQIIEDLLDMSRIISGKVRLDVQRVELLPVIEAALQTVRPAAEAKEIRLQPVLDPLAGPVSGDPHRLQQVFWNLLSNAVKFTPSGGRVQVLLERVNSHIEVSVIDTGEGIRPEFLPHVFDRFRQADASTTRRHGGLGLGLSLVKQLVEMHGGTVRAKSPGEGQGATFIVALPLIAVHAASDAEPAAGRRHPRASGPKFDIESSIGLAGVRVLVVDDEPDARQLVQRLLIDRDAQVTMAGSAQEAIRSLAAEPFDVIVSDIGMPGEDGYSLIRRVRTSGGAASNIPALALTAYARSEDRQRAILAGYQMHLTKPVEPGELIAMVASLAGRLATEG